jgi:malate synthase
MLETRLEGVEVLGDAGPRQAEVLTPAALSFLADLERVFRPRRAHLLERRRARRAAIAHGDRPRLPHPTSSVRRGGWRVRPAPPDLLDRRVEITGPVDRKMMIHALNSGAQVFMADLEDATSPTWSNVVVGQANLKDAVRRTIAVDTPEGGTLRLGDATATLVVRPRGWHLEERHVRVDGRPLSASLFDFGLYLFHNAEELLRRGTGAYYYLPKLEGRADARLWADVIAYAAWRLDLPPEAIRVTVLIEHILAAFEMEEILYELRDHVTGLNAGRWDYIFSVIKTFADDPAFLFPDRAAVRMEVPFMRAYTSLLVETCHRRGAHAIGGMSAFIPRRHDPEANARALLEVRQDKEREAGQGFDGTWVAHPGLVGVARRPFDEVLGDRPHQLDRPLPEVGVRAEDLLDVGIPGAAATPAGLRQNIRVALQYFSHWLAGQGAVAIADRMEDAATAEIARAQVWQWRRHGQRLVDGRTVDDDLVRRLLAEEAAALEPTPTGDAARRLFERVALSRDLVEFFTVEAYEHLP